MRLRGFLGGRHDGRWSDRWAEGRGRPLFMYGHEKSGDQQMLIPAESGGLLLSRFRSTIGAGGLNFSVRNGKRWDPAAITTLIFF